MRLSPWSGRGGAFVNYFSAPFFVSDFYPLSVFHPRVTVQTVALTGRMWTDETARTERDGRDGCEGADRMGRTWKKADGRDRAGRDGTDVEKSGRDRAGCDGTDVTGRTDGTGRGGRGSRTSPGLS